MRVKKKSTRKVYTTLPELVLPGVNTQGVVAPEA